MLDLNLPLLMHFVYGELQECTSPRSRVSYYLLPALQPGSMISSMSR